MRLLPVLRGAAGVTLAIAFAGATDAPASAAPADSTRGAIPLTVTRSDRFDFALRRAALEQAHGNLPGVVAQLEAVDFASAVAPARDRAAFLLAHAYAGLGRWTEFRRLATTVAQWRASGPFADWTLRRLELLDADAGEGGAGPTLVRLREASRPDTGASVSDSTGAAHRAQLIARAADEMDLKQWEAAAATYARAEDDRAREQAQLEQFLGSRNFAALWSAWEAGLAPGNALLVDAAPLEAAGRSLARIASDLDAQPTETVPALSAPAASVFQPASLPAPGQAEWQKVRSLERALSETVSGLDHTRAMLAREDADVAARQGYYAFGGRLLREEHRRIELRAARLDSLARSVAAIGTELDSVRAEATRRVVARAAVVVQECDAHLLWLGAMRHFHVEGPARDRPERLPVGVPGPDSLTRTEIALTQRIRDFALRMAAEAPALIARSHAEAWRPGVLDHVGAMAATARAQLAWSRALEGRIDSSRVAVASSATRRALLARADSLSGAVDSLRTAHETLRARTAESALRAAIAALDAEREAIDYGLAASSYGASLRAAALDSTVRTVVARSADGAAPVVAPEAPADDAETLRWRARAIATTEAFLERHPVSFARGEMRFRLADLLLTDARQGFRDRMAAFLAAQEAGRTDVALPLADNVRPLALYNAILAEDSSFVHRDAVLFNAGSILAEAGQAGADRYFRQLVATYPQSPFAQEVHLRIGDLHFDAGQYAECIAPYGQAAAGAEVNLRLVALYKLGWAEFSRERFLDAAGAFSQVLDLYEAGTAAGSGLDLRKETEAFLIHTFARAGGADAFAGYFDRVGARPYAPRLLVAMGQHFRRFSLYAQAERADSLHLERYPLDSEALVSAERRTDTFQRAGKPEKALEARAQYAPRFAAGSPWANAQSSDSVRAAGVAFARTSWAKVALHHHQKAAKDGSRGDWQEALRLYRVLLAQWPGDAAAPTFALQAGEASAALGDDAAALEYYATAARTGRDSIPDLALRQSLAVTDAAYERSRGRGGAAGSDSLARAVLAAGDALLAHDPGPTASAGVRWRQGNLAFAHGWYERAAKDFEPLITSADPRRAPRAAGLRAEAIFRLERYEEAGAAFEVARLAAVRAGDDSLALRAARAQPVCAYRLAEAAVRADSTDFERHARLFGDVAARWPAYEHAALAQYRSGLAYRKAKKPAESVAAMETLVRAFPRSEYVRDASLQVAQTWQEAGQPAKAADASVEFARRFPKDEGARDALLGAADLYAQAGDTARADGIRVAYVRDHPGDTVNGMAIREEFARRELAALPAGRPVASLLPAPTSAKSRKPAAPSSQLSAYLALAAANPELASRPLLAELHFRQGEDARPAYEAARLTLPLPKSIAQKRKLLDGLLALYRKSVDLGVTEWAQASAFRIGEALVGFGLALDASERPKGLAGDDLLAYEDVLYKESQVFYDRGEGVWTDVLTKRAKTKDSDSTGGAWAQLAETALWKRLGNRFLFKAEVRFPTVAAHAPKPAPQAPPTPATPAQRGSSAALAPGVLGSEEAIQHSQQETRP